MMIRAPATAMSTDTEKHQVSVAGQRPRTRLSVALERLRHALADRPARNFAWMLLERVVRLVLGLVVSIAVARQLGPADFGRLAYAIAFQAIFLVVAGLGLDDVLTRDLVRNTSADSLAASWRVRILGSLVAFAATLGAAWCWQPADSRTWWIVVWAASGLLFTSWDAIGIWYQVQERLGPPTVARLAGFVGSVALRFALIIGNAPVEAFAGAVALETIVRAAAFIWIFRHESSRWIRGSTNLRQLTHHFGQGAPLLASGLLVILTMQADRLLLVRWCGESEAGVFGAGARLTETLYALPIILGAVLMPRLLAQHAQDATAFWRLARTAAAGLTGISVVVAGVCTLLATAVIPRLFGASYEVAGNVFAIHVWSFVFVGIVSLRSRLLVVCGANHWVLMMSLVTTVLSLSANFWMIPRYGAIGAAWTSTIAWAVSALILPWLFPVPRRLAGCWLGLITDHSRDSNRHE